jgi:hypothetical protein
LRDTLREPQGREHIETAQPMLRRSLVNGKGQAWSKKQSVMEANQILS